MLDGVGANRGAQTGSVGDTMSRRERLTRSTGSDGRRQDAGKVVFLPEEIELELVGIIGPGGEVPGTVAVETVILDGDADLLALVESLREAALEQAPGDADAFDVAFPLDDRALN